MGDKPAPQTGPALDDVLNITSTKASTWTRTDLLKAICDLARPQPGFSGAEWARAIEAAADKVAGLHVNLDPDVNGPVRQSDGRSIWLQPDKNHLSHERVLAQEERILTFATHAQDPEPRLSPTVDVEGLDVMQADAARAVAGNDPFVLVVGPAGAGKTTTLERATTDLHHQGRPVFGITPTRKATRVLAAETGMPAETVAKLLTEYDRPHGPHEQYRLLAGTTLIVDEASMVGTGDLDRLVGLAQSQQWRLVLVGDPRQLQAVGRGGMFDEQAKARFWKRSQFDESIAEAQEVLASTEPPLAEARATLRLIRGDRAELIAERGELSKVLRVERARREFADGRPAVGRGREPVSRGGLGL